MTLTIRAARKPYGLEGVRIVKDPMRRGARGQMTEEEQPRTDANLGQGRDHECESKAQQLGVDINQVQGSGADGRVTVRDVQQAANQ